LVFRFSDIDAAIRVLEGSSVNVVDQVELYGQ
jgi:hypothetical protein